MGIRLDWEIEAERERKQQTAGEDPEMRRRRRRTRLRFLIVLFILLAMMSGAVAAVVFRLKQVEQINDQVLRDTVAAEVAALRLGDREDFLNMQRSASENWLRQQDANFDRYQTLKQTQDVNLSGRIIASQIDGSRGRVQIEEIIGGVPYGQVWFYWRYEDGWRHVPPDYTFWGEARTLETEGVEVRYQTIDHTVAEAVAPRVAAWLRQGCAALACPVVPDITIEIVPSATLEPGWSPTDPNVLQIPSPYATSARLDMPFDTGLQIKTAERIGERLVSGFTPSHPSDAYYLRQAIISWLVKRFAEIETNSFLISSLAERYGEQAVGRLLMTMQPNSSVSAISSVTGTTLDAANLDWRDFLTWRLAVEDEMIINRDETNFLLLYDTADTLVRDRAFARYSSGDPGVPLTVTAVVSQQGANGVPELRAMVTGSDPAAEQEDVVFRLVNGDWKRAS